MATGQANLGCDIGIELLDARLLPVYKISETEARRSRGGRGLTVRDFRTVGGRDNLGQAMILRLLTPLGELAPLGHPTYGARLHEIVGQPNSETTRNLAKLHILAALKDERRIEKVVAVDVAQHPRLRDLIQISVEVLPLGADVALALSFALELEGGET